MSRSKWKGSYVDKCLFKIHNRKYRLRKVWSRRSAIPSFLLNQRVLLHTGKKFHVFMIQKEHLGFKFGEFSFTRVKKKHAKKKKNK
jgi:small subunit ribosomal protein S19